jgi:ACR3 family arsenite transporter
MAIHNPKPTNSDKSLQHLDLEKQQQKCPSQQDLSTCCPTSKQSVYAGLGWLDRLLVLWILLAIIIGILLGNYVPSVGPALQKGKFVQVSVPIGEYIAPLSFLHSSPEFVVLTWFPTAVGLLVMMYPIMCKVKFETLHHVFSKRAICIQIGFSIFVNWIIAPFFMVSTITPNQTSHPKPNN